MDDSYPSSNAHSSALPLGHKQSVIDESDIERREEQSFRIWMGWCCLPPGEFPAHQLVADQAFRRMIYTRLSVANATKRGYGRKSTIKFRHEN
jgi:hypothetical protein